ncbi:hypothetical protein OROMI_014123 [Orobanche minor]
MASCSESEAEREAVLWEVGPTKDVVLALMETLVDPRLPFRLSVSDPPSLDAQISVAKQMHALALSLRLPLTAFMKTTNVSKSTAVYVSGDGLSVTGRAVKDACDITTALDVSKDIPVTEGVIDSKNENCSLRFGAVTEGVWSLIEYDINQRVLDEEKLGTKRKSMARYDSKLLQIAFDAVKDIAADLYRKAFDTNHIVPLRFLVESLQGPLVKKYEDSWATTDFVEYHQMHPYVGFISTWLSSWNNSNNRSIPKSGEEESTQSKKAVLPHSERRKNSSAEGPSRNTVTHENVSKKFRKRSEVAESGKAERFFISEIFDNDDYEYLKGSSLWCASKGTRSMHDFTRTYSKSENTSKNSNSKILACDQRKDNVSSFQHGGRGPDNGTNLKVDMLNLLKSNDTLCRDEKKTAEKGDTNISCNRSSTENRLPLVRFEGLNNIERKNKKVSQDMKNALALLYRKRQELCSQICTKEDELALYEDCIERIRDGCEVDLSGQCIKSIIIRGNSDLLPKNEIQVLNKSRKKTGDDHSNPQSEKQTKLCDVFLPGRSSCRYICLKNNWRFPIYFVELSDDKFLSNVTVGSKKFELALKGGLECSPCEARESAAAEMISKITTMFFG